MPYCGISALASVLGSASERSSVRVRATPEALDRVRSLAASAAGRRSSVEREARSSRSSSSSWEIPLTGPAAESEAAAPWTAGALPESRPTETARPVAASAIVEDTAGAVGDRGRVAGVRACCGAWRLMVRHRWDPTIGDMDVNRARRAPGACGEPVRSA